MGLVNNTAKFSELSKAHKDTLAQDVAGMQEIFRRKLGVFAYPAFGTLLGIVRNKDFIEDDIDIDMCWHSLGQTRQEVLEEVLAKYHYANRFGLLAHPHNRIGVMKVKVEHELLPITKMDMCVSWEQDDTYWVNIFGSYNQKLDLTPVAASLRGVKVYIPKDAEKFLEYTYGDWRTPKNKDTNHSYLAPHINWGSYLVDL